MHKFDLIGDQKMHIFDFIAYILSYISKYYFVLFYIIMFSHRGCLSQSSL